MIDSQLKIFNHESYNQLITYLTTTEPQIVLEKFSRCVSDFVENQQATVKEYLQDSPLLDFSEFKAIIESQEHLPIFIPDILELSVNLTNELHGDFEGGYDFGLDDQDDIAYLKPD